MEIVNSFLIDSTLQNAWKALLDVPLVVSCFPGATLTETLGEDSYKGVMRVKLGPIAMEFAGIVTLNDVSPDTCKATVKATWQETRNRGSATTVTTFALSQRDDGAATEVHVHTDVQMAGQLAQYGRGVGIIHAVSEQMVRQFAAKLQDELAAHPDTPETRRVDANAVPSSNAVEGESTIATSGGARRTSSSNELSVLALLWRTLVAKCRQWVTSSHSS
jgi:uncharacterized protein